MDITQRINDLIVITGGLADLLARENEALRAHRPGDVAGLVDEKNTLTRAYESRIKGLKEMPPDAIKTAAPELLERLKSIGSKVADLMETNAFLLKIAIEANRRVVEVIAEAARAQSNNAGNYGADGSNSKGGKGSQAQKFAVSLNQTL